MLYQEIDLNKAGLKAPAEISVGNPVSSGVQDVIGK